MALDSFANLKTAVAARLNNTEATDAHVTDFVTIAENEINRKLRALWNQKRAYAVPTGAYVAVPTDYQSLVSIQFTEGGYRYTLEQVSPHLLDQTYPSTSAGVPRYYAIHDGQFEFRPAFSSTNTTEVEITYYFKPAALSDTNTTNETLDNAPELLLYRALAEGFDFLFDEQRAVKYMQMYEKTKREIEKEAIKAKWSGVPLRVQVDSQHRMC